MKFFKCASIIAFQTLAACGGGDGSNTENFGTPVPKVGAKNNSAPPADSSAVTPPLTPIESVSPALIIHHGPEGREQIVTPPNNAAEEIRPTLDMHVDTEQQASTEDNSNKQITLPTQDTPLVRENAPNGVENIQEKPIRLLDSPPKTPPIDKLEDGFTIEWVKEFSRMLKNGELLTNRRINALKAHISKNENEIGENTYTFLHELINALEDCEPEHYSNGPQPSKYWGSVYSRPQKIKEILSPKETSRLALNIYTALREDYLIDNPKNLNSDLNKTEAIWAAKFSEKINESKIKLTNESIKLFTENLVEDKKNISENTFNFLISLLDELKDAEPPINTDEFEVDDDEYLKNLKKYHASVIFRTYRLSMALNIHKVGPSSLDEEVYRALCLGREYLTADKIRNLDEAAADILASSYTDIRDEDLSQSYDDISADATHIDDQSPLQ
ncbi:hypothetical protein [Mycoavidus sp. B2-EB]|uniref:hypothetical protein n=1 Tax=Mycoavidus sp. B2-EB TaxID=2651972 RepID=UPI001628AF91|nr:hypothetical protein [Mycoavidus sp. B2-EB]BBO59400.1 hypothetical protein MPB2EB_0516 [Mycoavidus sp. B2-EB]